jgi:hypothetical protein
MITASDFARILRAAINARDAFKQLPGFFAELEDRMLELDAALAPVDAEIRAMEDAFIYGTGPRDVEPVGLVQGEWARDDESTLDALLLVSDLAEIPSDVVATWTDEQCKEAEDYALAVHARASDNDIDVPERPAFLDEAVRAELARSEAQERELAEIRQEARDAWSKRCRHVWPLPPPTPQNCELCGAGRDGAPDIEPNQVDSGEGVAADIDARTEAAGLEHRNRES